MYISETHRFVAHRTAVDRGRCAASAGWLNYFTTSFDGRHEYGMRLEKVGQ